MLEFTFLSMIGTMLLAPVAGVVLIRTAPPRLLRRLCIASAALLLALLGSLLVGVETISIPVNITLCLAGYLAWCILAAACWRLSPRSLGTALTVFAYTPVALGYLSIWPMSLGLVFAIGDYVAPPLHTERPAPGLACRVTGWGMAASDDGYTVHLYRLSPVLPVLRWEVAARIVNETHPERGAAKSARCAGVAADWQAGR